MDLNNVELIGRLVIDPDIRTDLSGQPRATLRISVQRDVVDESGRTQSDTDCHTVFLFGNLVNVAEKYLKEGDRILVSGVGRYQQLEDLSQRGHLRLCLEVVADSLVLFGSKEDQPRSA